MSARYGFKPPIVTAIPWKNFLCHKIFSLSDELSLALLVLRVFTDNPNAASSSDEAAFEAHATNARFYLHGQRTALEIYIVRPCLHNA